MADREPARHRLPLRPEASCLAPDRQRPGDELPAHAGLLVEAGDDGGMDLLVYARDTRQDGRAHLDERIRDPKRVGEKGDREPRASALQHHQLAEVVGEREVEKHHVVVLEEAVHRVDGGRHRVVVAVADHAALRRPGRPGRVDDRVQVVPRRARRPPRRGRADWPRRGAARRPRARPDPGR